MSIFLTHQKKWGHFHQTWTPCVMTYDCKLHPLGTSSALHSFIENGFSFEASRLDWPKCHHQTDTPTMYLPQPRNALRWKLHEHGCRYDSRQHHNQKFTVPKSSGTWLKYILGCFKSEKNVNLDVQDVLNRIHRFGRRNSSWPGSPTIAGSTMSAAIAKTVQPAFFVDWDVLTPSGFIYKVL